VEVAIDEGSIETLGAWGPNWRAHHGRLLQNLADDGAKAVGFDLYFKTPNDHYDPAFLEGIRYAKSKRLGVVVGMEYDARQNRLSDPAPPVRAAVTAFASTYLQKDRVTNLVRYVSMFQSSGSADEGMTRLVPAFSLAVALAGGKRVEDFPRYREEDMALRCILAAKETQEGLSALTETYPTSPRMMTIAAMKITCFLSPISKSDHLAGREAPRARMAVLASLAASLSGKSRMSCSHIWRPR
jgi:CHASE2 domain-containing sensor protein